MFINIQIFFMIMGNRLESNQGLIKGQSLVSSNGHFLLAFQNDGNFVLYDKRHGVVNASTALWASNTDNDDGQWIRMQSDGNLVMRDRTELSGANVVWKTDTQGNPGSYLELKDSGNLEIIGTNWETDTTDPRLWTPSNFPLTFSDTHVVKGKLTAEVGEHGIGWIKVEGTHSGLTGSSKFGGRIALADSWGNITWMSDWVTVTVGADSITGTNTNDTRRDLEVPQDRIKLSVKGKTFLWRDPEDWINGRFDEEVIKFVTRANKVYKTIKGSEIWKDYQKSQVGENAPGDPPPTYE